MAWRVRTPPTSGKPLGALILEDALKTAAPIPRPLCLSAKSSSFMSSYAVGMSTDSTRSNW